MGSERRIKRPSKLLGISTLALLIIGLGSSVYLTDLYIKATEALQGGGDVDSFCNISTGVNCETVAASEYSSFLGIPVSVWGLEYFGLAIILVLLALAGKLAIKRWDSLLLALSLTGVPVTIVLGWISVTLIKSVCIMCMLVYAVNTSLVLLLAIPNRKGLLSFVFLGPKELLTLAWEPRFRVLTVLGVLVGLSQFFWMPPIFHRETRAAEHSASLLGIGDVKVGTWHGLPASGKSLGPADAPIQIEEFTDFQCPYCSRAHEVMVQMVKKYEGKIRLTHRDFPLDHNCNPAIDVLFHADACEAAYFARCAAEQDRFWPYEGLLFHNQKKLKKATMLSFAQEAGLDVEKMKSCVGLERIQQEVLKDIETGIKRGATGTPTFFIQGEKEGIVGAHPAEFWDEKIRSLLNPPPAQSTDPAPPAASQ